MSLLAAGAMVRVFGDPMQRIYGAKSDKAARKDLARWEALKAQGASEKLSRHIAGEDGCPGLGAWVIEARKRMEHGYQSI